MQKGSAAKRKNERARFWVKFGLPSKAEIKKNFKRRMAQFVDEANLVEDEKLRTVILECIESNLRFLNEPMDLDELLEHVGSSIDFVHIGIATGRYGILDPRTEKIRDRAQDNAMEREMLADQEREMLANQKDTKPSTWYGSLE